MITTRTRAQVFPLFVLLQCLDMLTTLIFLRQGVAEGNPLIAWVLHGQSPWPGLIAAKAVATMMGFYCYRNGRMKVLRLANLGYVAIVTWNLTTILAAMLTR